MTKIGDKITEQIMNYRDVLKEVDVMDGVKKSTQQMVGKTPKSLEVANKENTRKWHAKLY